MRAVPVRNVARQPNQRRRRFQTAGRTRGAIIAKLVEPRPCGDKQRSNNPDMTNPFQTALLRIAPALLMFSLTAAADPELPWTLRNHYSLPVEQGVLDYAEDNAEWRVRMKDGSTLVEGVGFAITLADGTELNSLNLGEGAPSRDPFTHELGDGTTYSVTFSPKNGIEVAHVIRTFKNLPFVFVEVSAKNVGTADIRVASIRPVVAETSVIQSLGPDTRIRYRQLRDTGGHPILVSEEEATMAVVHDPAKDFTFGLGLLPTGQARSTVAFHEQDGNWHGDIACHYEPAKAVAPGETLHADPLWISHGMPETHRVDMYYSWAYSMHVDPPERTFLARGWFTLDDSNSLQDYLDAATAWKRAGIDHVLLARGWEGRPGSLDGAASRFPKNMKSAVGSLEAAGLRPGITIDPLVAEEGGESWTAASSDGQAWLDPTAPGALAALRDKVDTLKGWGADFIVVYNSMIPDSALETFGLTRSEAQNAAFKALRDAASPLPVFPAAITPVVDDAEDWLSASGSVARMAVYGVIPAPLQYRVEQTRALDGDVVTAASFWPGPIEFQGTVNRQIRDELAELIAHELVAGQPMDAARHAPRSWQVQKYDKDGNLLSERAISVGGAAPAKPAQRAAAETDDAAS